MARNVDPLISVPRALVEPQRGQRIIFFCQKNQSRQSLMIEFSYLEVKLLHPYCIYCAPDFVLDAQSYPIFLVDIFMTSTLQAGVSKRHQKVPNWAIEVLKSSLHGKMKLFPAASPAAAIAANRGITVVCLLYLCSFYRECELFFIHTSIWQVFLRVLILFYQLNFYGF